MDEQIQLQRRSLTQGIEEGLRQRETFHPQLVRFNRVVSTGSTLLDLAISGDKIRGGGICGGILMEIYGPEGVGKTALMVEICTSAQIKGGDAQIDDPEGRLDREYARVYGIQLRKDNYCQSNTVTEVFHNIRRWQPKPKKAGSINVMGVDSLAALSTAMELEKEEGDKRGQRRAKEFSEGLRKVKLIIANNNEIICCTNQVRDSEMGEITPGGRGIPFYASLRIRVGPPIPAPGVSKLIEKTVDFRGVKVKQVIGIRSRCYIKKSSIAQAHRTADIFIIFGDATNSFAGVDDIRGNLQWYKDMTKKAADSEEESGEEEKKQAGILAVDHKFFSMERAIEYIETRNYEAQLRTMVIDLWEDLQRKIEVPRKQKVRF